MARFTGLAGVAVAMLGLAAMPAAAASPATEAFVANVRPNVDFLDRSSRLALDKSHSAAVRSFAHEEALEQTVAADSLVAWTQTNTSRGMDVALSRPSAEAGANPVADLAALPRDVLGTMAGGADALVTGRSVATAPALTVSRGASAEAPALLPAGSDNLARLRSLGGRRFDALYRTTQLDALRQLATLYRNYAANGDDPALRALALRELPRVNGRIVALRRL